MGLFDNDSDLDDPNAKKNLDAGLLLSANDPDKTSGLWRSPLNSIGGAFTDLVSDITNAAGMVAAEARARQIANNMTPGTAPANPPVIPATIRSHNPNPGPAGGRNLPNMGQWINSRYTNARREALVGGYSNAHAAKIGQQAAASAATHIWTNWVYQPGLTSRTQNYRRDQYMRFLFPTLTSLNVTRHTIPGVVDSSLQRGGGPNRGRSDRQPSPNLGGAGSWRSNPMTK